MHLNRSVHMSAAWMQVLPSHGLTLQQGAIRFSARAAITAVTPQEIWIKFEWTRRPSQFAELGSKPDAWGRGEVQVGSLQHSLVECVMTITQNAREVCQMLPTLCCAVCFISSFVPEDVSSSPYDCRRWAICVHSGKEFWSGL